MSILRGMIFLILLEVASTIAALALPLVFERFFAARGKTRLFGVNAWLWLRVSAVLLIAIALAQLIAAGVLLSIDPFLVEDLGLGALIAQIICEASEAIPMIVVAFCLEVVARLIHSGAALETESELTV